MQEYLIENLFIVGNGIVLFMTGWFSNFVFSLYYNIAQMQERFNKSKFIKGIIKALCIAVGTSLIVINITAVPIYCNTVGFSIPDEYINVFNILTIVSVFMIPTFMYMAQSIKTLSDIVSFKSHDVQ